MKKYIPKLRETPVHEITEKYLIVNNKVVPLQQGYTYKFINWVLKWVKNKTFSID